MRLLVTGGAGFIGSNFIRHILNKYGEYSIINLDKLTYAGNPENLIDLDKFPRYKFVKGDICNPNLVDAIAKDVDVIVNFAAETHVDRSIIDPGSFIETDVLGTYVLLEAAKRHNHQLYLQVSTDEVYGSAETCNFLENDPLNPSNPYSASKGSADLLARSYWVTYKLPVIITRSSNNFGPYQHPEKLIPLFITNALDDKDLPLYGDGLNVRDWIYVQENCEAIDLLLHRGEPGEVYNVSGKKQKKNIEVAELIIRELNKPRALIKFVKDRLGHDRRYSLDSSKIQSLGFVPTSNFTDALRNTIEWYKEHELWWRRTKEGEFEDHYTRANQ